MTETGTGRVGNLARMRRAPLAWAAFALIAQAVFATVLAPRLPESFLIWFNADRATLGDMYYRFGTGDFVVLGWVATAIFVAAAVLCYFFAGSGAGWADGLRALGGIITASFRVMALSGGQARPLNGSAPTT